MNLIRVESLKSHATKTGIAMLSLFLFSMMQGCSDIHSRMWNRAEAVIDGHRIVISPCRGSYTKTINDTPTERNHMFGCSDDKIKVEIKNEALKVNGQYYGMLGRGDTVIVKSDKVFINQKEAAVVAMK